MCESCNKHRCSKRNPIYSEESDSCESSKFALTIITDKMIGSAGPKGENGCVGPTGPKGENGCVGPTGPCAPPCKCIDIFIDFSKPTAKFNSSIIYKVDDKFILMVYGFAINDGSSCETRLCIKNESRYTCDTGIGLACRDSCADSKHFIQIDMGDYIRIKNLKCNDPKIRVGGFREKFHVYGSNKLGELGRQIYSNKCSNNDWFVLPSFNTCDLSDCGDLKQFGVLPFRYISFSSCGASIILNSLCVSVCC